MVLPEVMITIEYPRIKNAMLLWMSSRYIKYRDFGNLRSDHEFFRYPTVEFSQALRPSNFSFFWVYVNLKLVLPDWVGQDSRLMIRDLRFETQDPKLEIRKTRPRPSVIWSEIILCFKTGKRTGKLKKKTDSTITPNSQKYIFIFQNMTINMA